MLRKVNSSPSLNKISRVLTLENEVGSFDCQGGSGMKSRYLSFRTFQTTLQTRCSIRIISSSLRIQCDKPSKNSFPSILTFHRDDICPSRTFISPFYLVIKPSSSKLQEHKINLSRIITLEVKGREGLVRFQGEKSKLVETLDDEKIEKPELHVMKIFFEYTHDILFIKKYYETLRRMETESREQEVEGEEEEDEGEILPTTSKGYSSLPTKSEQEEMNQKDNKSKPVKGDEDVKDDETKEDSPTSKEQFSKITKDLISQSSKLYPNLFVEKTGTNRAISKTYTIGNMVSTSGIYNKFPFPIWKKRQIIKWLSHTYYSKDDLSITQYLNSKKKKKKEKKKKKNRNSSSRNFLRMFMNINQNSQLPTPDDYENEVIIKTPPISILTGLKDISKLSGSGKKQKKKNKKKKKLKYLPLLISYISVKLQQRQQQNEQEMNSLLHLKRELSIHGYNLKKILDDFSVSHQNKRKSTSNLLLSVPSGRNNKKNRKKKRYSSPPPSETIVDYFEKESKISDTSTSDSDSSGGDSAENNKKKNNNKKKKKKKKKKMSKKNERKQKEEEEEMMIYSRNENVIMNEIGKRLVRNIEILEHLEVTSNPYEKFFSKPFRKLYDKLIKISSIPFLEIEESLMFEKTYLWDVDECRDWILCHILFQVPLIHPDAERNPFRRRFSNDPEDSQEKDGLEEEEKRSPITTTTNSPSTSSSEDDSNKRNRGVLDIYQEELFRYAWRRQSEVLRSRRRKRSRRRNNRRKRRSNDDDEYDDEEEDIEDVFLFSPNEISVLNQIDPDLFETFKSEFYKLKGFELEKVSFEFVWILRYNKLRKKRKKMEEDAKLMETNIHNLRKKIVQIDHQLHENQENLERHTEELVQDNIDEQSIERIGDKISEYNDQIEKNGVLKNQCESDIDQQTEKIRKLVSMTIPRLDEKIRHFQIPYRSIEEWRFLRSPTRRKELRKMIENRRKYLVSQNKNNNGHHLFNEVKIKVVFQKFIDAQSSSLGKKIVKLLDPLNFFRETSDFYRFGLIHTSLVVKNLIFHWLDNALVTVRSIEKLDGYEEIFVCDAHCCLFIDEKKFFYRKMEQLAFLFVDYNSSKSYSSWGNPSTNGKNCQHFVMSCLKVLEFCPFIKEISSYQNELKNILERKNTNNNNNNNENEDGGEENNKIIHERFLKINWCKEFEKNFCHLWTSSSSSKEGGEEEPKKYHLVQKYYLCFETHQKVDEFTTECINWGRKKLDVYFPTKFKGIYYLLKAFDRSFWMNREKRGENEVNRKSEKTGCPFTH